MAIDSATKRFSITHLGGELDFLPKPDGTVGSRDRLVLITLYSGINDTESGGGGGPGPAGAGIQMMLGIGI